MQFTLIIALMSLFSGVYAPYPTTLKTPTTIAYDLPVTPTTREHGNPLTVAVNSTGISVSWSPIQNAIGYHVLHGPSDDPNDRHVKIVANNVTSVWLDSHPNTMYDIEVVATLPDNKLEHVGKTEITTKNDVFIVDSTEASVQISWGAVINVEAYHIIHHPVETKTRKSVDIAESSATEYIITGLRPKTRYEIEVVAVTHDDHFVKVGSVQFRTDNGASKGVPIVIIAGSAGAGFCVLLLVVAIIIVCRRKCSHTTNPQQSTAAKPVTEDNYHAIDNNHQVRNLDRNTQPAYYLQVLQDRMPPSDRDAPDLPQRPPQDVNGVYLNPNPKIGEAQYVSMKQSKAKP